MSNAALQDAPSKSHDLITPHWHQHAQEIQKFGTVARDLPIGIDGTLENRSSSLICSPSGFRLWAASALPWLMTSPS
jgi:hypothetical protein